MAAAIKRLSTGYSKMPSVIVKISYIRHAVPVCPGGVQDPAFTRNELTDQAKYARRAVTR
jgi:hypothetical protein